MTATVHVAEVTAFCRDYAEKIARGEAERFHAVLCDPPAGIEFMSATWDQDHGGRDEWIEQMRGAFASVRACLLPGAHGFVWALPRTAHWTMTALEDAGFEIRDVVSALFGSGFPKSANVSKHIDAQERKRWLDIGKAIDIVDEHDILNAWRVACELAEPAGARFVEASSALAPALLSVSPEKSGAGAIIAELRSCEAHLTDAASWRSALLRAAGYTLELNALVTIAEGLPESHDATRSMEDSSAALDALEWLDESTRGSLKGAEALMIWLGSKPSSMRVATAALCAALTDDLRRIMLSRSATFRAFDTTSQTDFASATTATITESTAASLISFTVATLRREAVDRALGAKRKVIGTRPIAYPDSPSGYTSVSANSSAKRGGIWNPVSGESAHGRPVTAPATEAAQGWDGHGTALKPATEFWILVRNPIDGTVAQNAMRHGTGALAIDAARIVGPEGDGHWSGEDGSDATSRPGYDGGFTKGGKRSSAGTHCGKRDESGRCMGHDNAGRSTSGATVHGPDTAPPGRWPANLCLSHVPPDERGEGGCVRVGTKRVKTEMAFPVSPEWTSRTGWGKVGYNAGADPQGYADADGMEAVDDWRCVDGCPVAALDAMSVSESGASRFFHNSGWDAEVYERIHAEAPFRYVPKASRGERDAGLDALPALSPRETVGREPNSAGARNPRAGAGGLSGAPTLRCRKCERNVDGGRSVQPCHLGGEHDLYDGPPALVRFNHHPTVKSLTLTRWLATLLLPPSHVAPRRLLNPFAGSGGEAVGAMLAGFEEVVGIEMSEEYAAIARARIAFWERHQHDDIGEAVAAWQRSRGAQEAAKARGQMSFMDAFGAQEEKP